MLPGDSVLISGCWLAALSVASQGNGCVGAYRGVIAGRVASQAGGPRGRAGEHQMLIKTLPT